MQNIVIIPAQIRAARALIDWSQEKLAKAAGIALTSVRDIEGQKRDAGMETIAAIRQALENAGIVFVSGNSKDGPGVRLVANRPNIIRRPTTVTAWDGIPFTVEWQGKPLTVFVVREVIEDLGKLKGNEPESAYLVTFENHVGNILDGVKKAVSDKANFDRQGCLHVRGKDIPALA